MIWVGFCSSGKTPIRFIATSMKSKDYVQVLEDTLIPFAADFLPDGYIFQQDNAPCHTAIKTEEWFEEKGIWLIDHPPRSPDLNPVKNLFVILANMVYDEGKQFKTCSELEIAIVKAWDSIETTTLAKLTCSMHNRCKSILQRAGNTINY